MKTPTIQQAILAFCLAVPSMLLASPQIEVAKAIGVRGDVTITSTETGTVARLKENALFNAGTTVTTGKNSSATIMFSTGTFVAVPSNTTFSIDLFEQESFGSEKGSFETLKVEPSVSDLRITLEEGRMSGRTAKLNPDSNLQIGTPAGDVYITGTTWDIVLTETSDGTSMSITNLSGVVTYNLLGTFASIQSGDTMSVRFGDVDQSNGEVEISGNGSVSEVDARAILDFLLTDLSLTSPSLTEGVDFPSTDTGFLDITVISVEQ